MDLVLRPPEGRRELEQAFDVRRRAFGGQRADFDRWAETSDERRLVCAVLDGEVVGLAGVWAFGQYFGGRRVPMGGVASVAVAPEHRGRAVASGLMTHLLAVMRDRGEVVSGLYPATTALYRRAGYEVAGVWGDRRVRAATLRSLRDSGVAVRRAQRPDVPAIKDCYRRLAPTRGGHLDRPDMWWRQILEEPWDDREIYVVDGDAAGEVAAYVVYRQTPAPDWGYGISVLEHMAGDRDAAVALWRTVGSSATQARDVRVQGPPEHPLLLLLDEQGLDRPEDIRYMLRLVDAQGAVAARGYPPGVDVAVDLDIADAACDWNRGRFTLSVGGGEGKLVPGGSGAVSLDIRGLAALYAGYASPATLVAAGLLGGGSPEERAAMGAPFAGPTPWLSDFF